MIKTCFDQVKFEFVNLSLLISGLLLGWYNWGNIFELETLTTPTRHNAFDYMEQLSCLYAFIWPVNTH